MSLRSIAESQRKHWEKALYNHGGTSQAVGSETVLHKALRYARISSVFEDESCFSLHDVGAGIGHYYEYLMREYQDRRIQYSGSDVTQAFCDIATREHPGATFFHRDILVDDLDETYDFVVLSGVFHQHGGTSFQDWARYSEALLVKSFSMARRGMAFNVLSEYADFYNHDLYYASLGRMQRFIVRRLSRFFRMDHAYPLFEATFCVYQPDTIREHFPEPEFAKYLK